MIVTFSMPDFGSLSTWNWVLLYLCVAWFIGFFLSLKFVKHTVKIGDISPKNKGEKVLAGILFWSFSPIILPLVTAAYSIYYIFSIIYYIAYYILYLPLAKLYDFKS